MALFSLADAWTIELHSSFQIGVEDGSVVLSNEESVVWVDLFEDDRPVFEKLAQLKSDLTPQGAKVWEFTTDDIQKFGFLTRDEDDEVGGWELTTLSVVPEGYALLSFYFDEAEEVEWALQGWRSVKFSPVE